MSADPVIEPSELQALSEILLLDARPAEAYAAGHPAGAVHVPVKQWDVHAKSAETSLDRAEHWEAALATLGVDGTCAVAVYDDGGMTDAARVWFVLQRFGVPAFVINGGWPALREQGPAAPRADSAERTPPPRHAVALYDRHRLRGEIASRTQIFDARTAAEYDGVDRRGGPRGGRVPGAIRLGHAELLDQDRRLLPADELKELLTAKGFVPGEPVVTYCAGGGRAALAALAAVRAGFSQVGVYYLSFADWARDDTCPVETGASDVT